MSAPLALLLASATASAAPEPSLSIETGQRISWAGMGMSTVGTSLVLIGGVSFYKGPFDAVNRYQGGRDPQKTDPGTAIASGLVVGSGMGISAIGRPVLSFGSALTARAWRAEGGSVSPALGWVSVGAWAAGVGTYFAAQATGSDSLDWAWAGMRATSYGTGLAQLLQTQASMRSAGSVHRSKAKPPTVQLVLGPGSGTLVGRF